MLRIATAEEVRAGSVSPVDPSALREAAEIVEDVRSDGESAIRRHTMRLDAMDLDARIIYSDEDLRTAFNASDPNTQQLLERAADRIERFASAQRKSISNVDIEVPGGRAGHNLTPVGSVGAYAPGGRYPLPSTVLMTVVPAKVAGVPSVWLTSPSPSPVTLAAAHVAGADGLLAIGGAQAIAALAFGVLSPRCDLVVGPGNKWVTAAKKYLYGEIGIDGLAGPSEILVIADERADPALVASDLIAQAEHDPAARPMLIALSTDYVEKVNTEVANRLVDLPTAPLAREALAHGIAIVADDLSQAASLSDHLAPEHLALHVEEPERLAATLTNYGAIFLGPLAAEAIADYGIGPNHVLPTGGSARFQSGLSVSTFLRAPTWLRMDDTSPVSDDIVALARLEGLEGHARAALARRQ